MGQASTIAEITNQQWVKIERLIGQSSSDLPLCQRELRKSLNGMWHVACNDCPWHKMPDEFGLWGEVYGCFWQFRQAGVWSEIHCILREESGAKEPEAL